MKKNNKNSVIGKIIAGILLVVIAISVPLMFFFGPQISDPADNLKDDATCVHAKKEEILGFPATCEEPGRTKGIKCSSCDKVLEGYEKIPAGHNFEGEVCIECGYGCPHSYVEGVCIYCNYSCDHLFYGLNCNICDITVATKSINNIYSGDLYIPQVEGVSFDEGTKTISFDGSKEVGIVSCVGFDFGFQFTVKNVKSMTGSFRVSFGPSADDIDLDSLNYVEFSREGILFCHPDFPINESPIFFSWETVSYKEGDVINVDFFYSSDYGNETIFRVGLNKTYYGGLETWDGPIFKKQYMIISATDGCDAILNIKSYHSYTYEDCYG